MGSKKFHRIDGCIVLLLILSACAPEKPEYTPQQLAGFNLATAEADSLYAQGSYLSLKKAFDTYESQMDFPAFQNRTRTKLLKCALLLSLRENELFIAESRHLAKVMELIDSYPELAGFSSLAAVVSLTSQGGSIPLRRKLYEEYDLDISMDWINKNLVELNADLKKSAEVDPFYTYFYLTLNDKFRYNLEGEKDFDRFKESYRHSPLIQYKLSLFPQIDRERLETFLQENPDFYEVFYFLGNLALAEGYALTAEKNLLKALEHIPSSISILKNLAQIFYRLEEFEQSLAYNERILSLLPDYRDALLAKAICLSYLGRHDEAVLILNKLIEMGMYLMGESHYWLAWNLNETGQLDEAMENIKRALNYLIGHSEVHLLAGIIAFEKGDLDGSEEHLKKTLWINQESCEASYYLGKIASTRKNWQQSGTHFENSALCNRGLEKYLIDKIREIEESSFSAARKEKHIARKRLQLKKVQLTKATAYYNAAAGYFNSGLLDKALNMAQIAREHESIRPIADELITKIKNSVPPEGNKK